MLAGALGYRPDRKNFDTFTGKSGEERIRETLLLNPAIDGDRSIVNRLIAEGEVVHFRKRDRIIQEGAQDDAVYFLLAGEVVLHPIRSAKWPPWSRANQGRHRLCVEAAVPLP